VPKEGGKAWTRCSGFQVNLHGLESRVGAEKGKRPAPQIGIIIGHIGHVDTAEFQALKGFIHSEPILDGCAQ
jgi:hypothetical protein